MTAKPKPKVTLSLRPGPVALAAKASWDKFWQRLTASARRELKSEAKNG